ncbi:hypothetical protein GMST_01850 [Geomonas silvestris]|uniref:SMF family protein n=1 Tax=Geomonas silvestris TaxID=2740184 RepID=A0A6V8MCY4_9BACT|nr:SMF family protein [Geomonas silvestris]GFO57860.1 hypothetical protein GMST_01850 [Geomonas silvestris]
MKQGSFGGTLGNRGLLQLHKTAFFASHDAPAGLTVLARGWFERCCGGGGCVISGFQTPLERTLLGWLLEAGHPLVLVLARGLPLALAPGLERALERGELLVLTRYAASVTHACRDKCRQRNRHVVALADAVVVAYAAPGGELARLCAELPAGKPVSYLCESPGAP